MSKEMFRTIPFVVVYMLLPKTRLEYNRIRKNFNQMAEGNFVDDPLLYFILKSQSNTMQYVFAGVGHQLAKKVISYIK